MYDFLFVQATTRAVKSSKATMRRVTTNTNRPLRFPIVAGALLATALLVSAHPGVNAGMRVADSAGSATHAPAENRQHWYQFGRASWYGHALQGLPTASGEAYDMNALTCAHRSLPLGALVRVTNLRNHRSLVVRVNDRGPFLESRVVDLSYAAAQRLGFSQRGTAKVRLDLIDAKPTQTEVALLTLPTRP
jgi:peptidoglycan lytic transglycosylase